MDKVFLVIAAIAGIGVVISLFRGFLAMGGSTKEENQKSQKMMQMRVICQGIALVSLFLAYLAKH
jgi:hypothetical protein